MPRMLTLNGIDDIKARVGQELGISDWLEVTQAEIDKFAEATGDHQWIHVDVDKASQTPFGGTIAHGYYTLSLAPRFSYELYTIENVAFALNYGANKVRFPAPLKVGAKVRMRATLSNVEDVAGGVQITTTCTFETEGGEKPVCVAETLTRVFAG
jgi:acyl dehydratase